MHDLVFVLAAVCALGAGTIGGVFFAFSTFVMAALARLPAAQGIAAMQAINVVVLNRLFLGVFVGTVVVCVLLAVVGLFAGSPGVIAQTAGAVLYVIGSFGVTMRFNVPLNEALARAEPGSAEGAAVWSHYLARWTAWNHVRTLASILAAAAFIVSLR